MKTHGLCKNRKADLFFTKGKTKTLNKQIEFKVAEKDGQLGYYDILTPLYAAFHDDDKTFSLMWTEYHEDFNVFYQNYMQNQIQYGGNHGVLAQARTLPPENSYVVSCVPWISFKHFAVHSYESKSHDFPSAEAGKFYEKGGEILIPLSLLLAITLPLLDTILIAFWRNCKERWIVFMFDFCLYIKYRVMRSSDGENGTEKLSSILSQV